MRSNFKDLVNKRFGKLVVVKIADYKNTGYRWLCRCDCGNTCIVQGGNLRKSQKPTRSCGCNKNIKAKLLWKSSPRCKRQYSNTKLRDFKNHIKRHYKLGLDDWHYLIQKQCGKCQHCNRQLSDSIRPSIDHDHSSGQVRSIVCHACNITIGFLENNKDWWIGLMKNYAYLYAK